MRILITKEFENVPGEILQPGWVLDMWDVSAKRAIKEKAAVEIPPGVDEKIFIETILKTKK